jgi:tRNA 2-selenouridine synthase
MAVRIICVEEFLKLSSHLPVADVRSPGEFLSGHIPGAVNIPLFNDSEREVVGIKYKKEGRINAIREGVKLISPSLATKLDLALGLAKEGNLLVHCWRGGMRSEAMAWLFSLGGLEIAVLEGGYKQYRHHILESLAKKRKMIVLGGMTGSSKTHILLNLKEKGCRIIDLEGLANHKGSAFGSLGQPPQPTTEHFANLLYEELKTIDPETPFWLEDESRNIGTVFLPDPFYSNMQDTSSIMLMMDIKTRLPRLMEEYSVFPPEQLKESVLKISKRLGGDNTRDAIEAIDTGDYAKAIKITLLYYDKAYMYGLKKKNEGNIITVNTDTDNVQANAAKVLEAAGRIDWKRAGFTEF